MNNIILIILLLSFSKLSVAYYSYSKPIGLNGYRLVTEDENGRISENYVTYEQLWMRKPVDKTMRMEIIRREIYLAKQKMDWVKDTSGGGMLDDPVDITIDNTRRFYHPDEVIKVPYNNKK